MKSVHSASYAGGTRHVSVCCYENSSDLLTVDPRGLTKVMEEPCLVQCPGRVFQISSDGVDRMQAKIKTPKNSPPPLPHRKKKSHAEFPSLKSL